MTFLQNTYISCFKCFLEMAHTSNDDNIQHDIHTEQSVSHSVALFRDPKWLGFKHDGYPISTFLQYRAIRGTQNPTLFDKYHVSILQSWLSFGLLEAILEVPIPESMLLRETGDRGLVMSLDQLPQILSEWTSRVSGKDEDLSSHRDRVESVLLQTHKILSYLSDTKAFDYADAYSDDIPATFVALGCIAEALTQARHCLYSETSPERGYDWGFVVAPYSDKLYADAVADGWCLSTINYLVNKSNLSVLRFAVQRGPLIQTERHEKCSAHFCALKTVDTANYIPKHISTTWDSSCSCSYIKPPIEAVNGKLQEGINPVITLLDVFDRKNTSLSVGNSTDVPYVAISHVWADGCGSTAEVGLPLCQVWKLSAIVSGIISSGAFWMDALCVPKHPETRKRALKLMGKAYLDAEIVLVLDSTIQSCSSKAPSNELLLHLVLSPWMRRLWTLQDAVLAKKLVFLFSDGLLPLSRLIPDLAGLYTNTTEAGLAAEIHRLTKLRSLDTLKFADVARSLRWRWTSKPTDEVPAIVSLLSVDRQAIFEDPVEKRMINLLLAVANLPRNIIFLAGPKMETSGFRWAPLTSMSIATGTDGGGLDLNTTDTSALCTPRGLLASYFVFSFEKRSFKANEHWNLHDPTTNRAFFISNPRLEKEMYCCNFLLCDSLAAPSGVEMCIAVLGNVDADGQDLDCIYVTSLKINGQRPDKPVENEVLVLSSGARQVCIS